MRVGSRCALPRTPAYRHDSARVGYGYSQSLRPGVHTDTRPPRRGRPGAPTGARHPHCRVGRRPGGIEPTSAVVAEAWRTPTASPRQGVRSAREIRRLTAHSAAARRSCVYLPLRYAVGDEQQVKVRCGRLIATQYGRLGVVFERHRGGPVRAVLDRPGDHVAGLVRHLASGEGSAVEG